MQTNCISRDGTVAAYNITIVGLSKDIDQGSDNLMKMTANEIRKHYGLPRHEEHPESAKTMGGKSSRSSLNEGRALRENIERDQTTGVKEKALHGKFFKYLNESFADKEASLAWLQSPGLKGEMKSLIIAAQDHALNTRYHQRKILYLQELGIEVPNKWYENVPQPVVNTDSCIIMWDKGVFTDLTTSANCPDIIIHNKEDKLCLLIDIVIPMDHNIVVKENDKLTKYKNL
ncbi:unnamed protein product [Leuciscus chuanchicus]